jgi:hypothetical protein
MPIRFIKAEKAIAREIEKGKIPKYYYKNGVKTQSNPYALARKATGYYGSTHEATNKTAELIIKGNSQYVHRMKSHLNKEHPSVRGNIFIRK